MALGTEEEGLGEKERTQILIAEYNSLRSEINSRVSNACQVGAIGIAAFAIFANAGIKSLAITALLIVAGTVIVLWFIFLWIIFRNFFKAALRVQELERDINKRGREKLLIWENERGGLAIGEVPLRLVLRFFWLRKYRFK